MWRVIIPSPYRARFTEHIGLFGYFARETGSSKVLDHIDGNKTNNTLENLRDVTVRQNNFNKRGTKGFHWSAKWGKWVAAIRTEIGSNPKYLGAYDTELDARAAYLRAKSVFHKF